jgi:hypothetical protein
MSSSSSSMGREISSSGRGGCPLLFAVVGILDFKSSSYSDEYKQSRIKLIELEQLLTPFCPPQYIHNILNTIVRHCNM